MGRAAVALAALALVLPACGKKDTGRETSEASSPKPATPPAPAIAPVPNAELAADGDWRVTAWDVTTPNTKGYLTVRVVDRDGSALKWSSKTLVRTSEKLRVTLRFRVVEREIRIRWSVRGDGHGSKGDGSVPIAEGVSTSPSLSVEDIPYSNERHPLVIGRWHALILHAWAPAGSEPSADVPMGEEWFTLRLDGRKVDLATYSFPVLQAHVRFTAE